MRILLNRWFARFVRKEKLSRAQLCNAILRAQEGLVDADLGGGLIKQRIPRPGQGHSGGYRAIIVFRSEDRAIFLLGFAKNERDNIDDDELRAMKEAARDLLELSDEMIDKLVEKRSFMEIDCSGQAL